MADTRRYGASNQPGGSLFLFDRKVLRYFRKDGHNWRKKKDGKTVKEAHERLKAGSIDVLHCYYAHGEDNENFQRRCYWLLEEEHSNIVLVHYLEVKGNRMNIHRIRESEEVIANSQETGPAASYENDTSLSYDLHEDNYQLRPEATDTTASTSCQASEYEDTESAYDNQASSIFHSVAAYQQNAGMEKVDSRVSDHCYSVARSNDYQENLSVIPGMNFLSLTPAEFDSDSNDGGLTFEGRIHLDLSTWDEVLGNYAPGREPLPAPPLFSSADVETPGTTLRQGDDTLGLLFADSFDKKQEPGSHSSVQEESQWLEDHKLHSNSVYHPPSRFQEEEVNHVTSKQNAENSNAGNGYLVMPETSSDVIAEGKASQSSLKQPFSDILLAEDGLKKMDSFNRWMSKELGDVSDIHMQSSSGAYWDTVEGETGVDSSISSQELENAFMLSPSLSHDQLFSIMDFSPIWGYANSEIKVLITGRFLRSHEEVAACQWSCMFGEVEVPAEVIADGVLRCRAPAHKVGRVPFYVTCSNRLACSEVREFEFRVNQKDTENINNESMNEILKMRFAKLLSLSSVPRPNSDLGSLNEKSQLSAKICPLLKEDSCGWDQMLQLPEEEFSLEKMKEQLLQKLLKENLYAWLLEKVAEGGKGASVLDEEGQGVLHFAAALGYDWALQPTILAGVSVNFRDLKGWTALHWAAYCGRERTVASLMSLGAAPGALTDPTPKYPGGRTPADLASSNGHKGIAGYLAVSALRAQLSSLDLDKKEAEVSVSSRGKAVQTISERSPTPCGAGDLPSGLSLKDSLAAVCNATQAAARIHQVFRVQSFQRKLLKEYSDNKFGISNERALSMVAVKGSKLGQIDDSAHVAAIRIQNKYRGWKRRKEFLTIRRQIVKIQAHVRGHQVRKNYKKITWSVGILEKVILRWRRKGSGLRGFKSEALAESSSSMVDATSSNGDDFDLLKEGRKQTEERVQKFLARVKSMVRYPEARDQYSRLLNVVNEIQEAQTSHEMASESYEETAYFDDVINIEDLLDDDSFMPMTS
ncbi:calmodulin-binding transcription activator 3 isoform X2 [Punica granatum]|uniref:Calmodulin-binding transcription activator 3 isoform X2 n=1 Tax=Punica granatum TaxID=22663 RepID=A0A6P8D3D4_PUNGR|nr:calmodulin-binding transcription activator 3 isoform X2 [Punica granatum]